MRLETLPIRIRDDEITPSFLGEIDVPWLSALLELVQAHAGSPWRDLDARLRHPVVDHAPPRRQALAVSVLRRLLRGRVKASVAPRRVRAVVFGLAATNRDRASVLSQAAGLLEIDERVVGEFLFADLPGERRVVVPASLPTPADLAVQANLFLCRALLARAAVVDLQLLGNARAVVRLAQLRGLICTISRTGASSDLVTLSVSGPLSLFRRTTIYGRALGDLVPALGWCNRFQLRARCIVRDQELGLVLRSGDPILPGGEGRRFDSRVERRLARDLQRLLPDWMVLHEPEPIALERSFLFPDFALVHRYDPARRWLLEVVGFWTPEYVHRKLASYRAAGIDRLILCVDEKLDCADGEMPAGARIVRYRRHVDAMSILDLLGERGVH